MKKILFTALFACVALLSSCEAPDTCYFEGNIYGVWALDSKFVVTDTDGKENRVEVDYSGVHFFLSLSEPGVALAKKGSFTELDLKDVDVDGSRFSYDASKKQISFEKTLWLTQGLSYEMRLSGTFEVLELTQTKLVIQKESMGIKTSYAFHSY